MKLLFSLVFLAAQLFCEGAHASSNLPHEKLLIEQVGPSDASISPFAVEIGNRATSNIDTVFVTPETFSKLKKIIRQADGGKSAHYPPGTLLITSVEDKEQRSYTIYPNAMLPVIIQLIRILPLR